MILGKFCPAKPVKPDLQLACMQQSVIPSRHPVLAGTHPSRELFAANLLNNNDLCLFRSTCASTLHYCRYFCAVLRWRRVSARQMPAETDTLRLSTVPSM